MPHVPQHVRYVVARTEGFSVHVGEPRRVLKQRALEELEEDKPHLQEFWRRAAGDSSGVTLTRLLDAYRGALPALVGQGVGNNELYLLAAFTSTNRHGVTDEGGFYQGVMIWKLMQKESANWSKSIRSESKDGVLEPEHVFPLMNTLNDGASHFESEWVFEVAANVSRSKADREKAMLLAIATWVINATPLPHEGILRVKFVERLLMEYVLSRGCLHFWNLLLLFVLATAALTISSMGAERRGIRQNLVERLSLDQVAEVNSISELNGFLDGFSEASTILAPLSSKYFGMGASLRLLDSLRSFSAPERLPETQFWLGEAFTLHAWVRLTDDAVVPPSGGLPIFRRALSASGPGSSLSCLRWNFPPSLDFGAHDFGGSGNAGEGGLAQEHVSVLYPVEESRRPVAANPMYHEYSRLVLHTLVVDGMSATFYVDNATVLHHATLPRVVTNCASKLTTVGADGLTLAMVTYYPRALMPSEIEEVYHAGDMLRNLGYMNQPTFAGDLSDMQHLMAEIAQNAVRSASAQAAQLESADAFSTLTTAVLTNPAQTQVMWQDSSLNAPFYSDPVFGYPVMDILLGPAVPKGHSFLNPSTNTAFPRFSKVSGGFTISVWTMLSQQGYLILRAAPDCTSSGCEWRKRSMCWAIYVTPARVQLRTNDLRWTALFDMTDAPPGETPRGAAFRHLVLVVNPSNTTAPQLVCVDGLCEAHQGLEDCEDSAFHANLNGDFWEESLNRSKVWISGRPPGAVDWPEEVANFKVFDRALTDAEVSQLFREDPDPVLAGATLREVRGCRFEEELADDPGFRDEHGHDCFWYYNAKAQGQPHCDVHMGARQKCMLACQSYELCLGSSRPRLSTQLWSQQVEIRSKGTYGSMCVAKSTTAAKEAIKCGINAAASPAQCAELGVQQCGPVDCSKHEFNKEALLECLKDTSWTSMGMTGRWFLPCHAIVEGHDFTCDWDDSGLTELAAASNLTQEWAMQLWFEAVQADGCFLPEIRLINGAGLTFARVYTGDSLGALPALDPPGGIGCYSDPLIDVVRFAQILGSPGHAPSGTVFVVAKQPKPGTKHLLFFGRKRACQASAMQVDEGSDEECVPGVLPEIQPDLGFLRVIAIMGNVRLSPITLSAVYPSAAARILARYSAVHEQQVRAGASPTQRQQMSLRLERTPRPFKEKTVLVSPPLLFQSRRQGRQCEWQFAKDFFDRLSEFGHRLHCEGVYACGVFTKDSTQRCRGELDTGPFFGLEPRPFRGQHFYVELLETITSIPLVVRESARGDRQREVVETNQFIDTLTEELQIRSVFFSAVHGITTVLTVTFKNEPEGWRNDFTIVHFVALTGGDLLSFELLLGFSFLVQLVYGIQVFLDVRHVLRCWSSGLHAQSMDIGMAAVGVLVEFLSFASSASLAYSARTSAADTEEIVGPFSQQDWSSPDSNVDRKMNVVVTNFENLLDKVRRRETIEQLAMAQILWIFVGLTMATHAHPRISLVTATIEHVLGDVIHFSIIFILVLLGFAVIGTWRFGSSREDMSTIQRTMWTQIDAILGPPGTLGLQQDVDRWEYLMFVMMLHCLNFFLLVNFFLAIIVGGYERFRNELDSTDVENNVVSDTLFLIRRVVTLRRCRHSLHRIAERIQELPSMYVSLDQMKEMTEFFPSQLDAERFYSLYAGFDALVTPPADAQAISQQSLFEMETRLKCHIQRMIAFAESGHEHLEMAGSISVARSASLPCVLNSAPAENQGE